MKEWNRREGEVSKPKWIDSRRGKVESKNGVQKIQGWTGKRDRKWK